MIFIEMLLFQVTSEVSTNFQIVKTSLTSIDSISLYRSSSKSLIDASTSITKMIDLSKATLVTGDFNVCLIQSPNNNITTSLKKLGFKQLIGDATHILGKLGFQNYFLKVKLISTNF